MELPGVTAVTSSWPLNLLQTRSLGSFLCFNVSNWIRHSGCYLGQWISGPLNERSLVPAGLQCCGSFRETYVGPARLSCKDKLLFANPDGRSGCRSSVAEVSREGGMTVKTNNRSHRVVYLIVLLVFAVALTTALVLAGERKPEGNKSSRTLQPKTVPTLSTAGLPGTNNA